MRMARRILLLVAVLVMIDPLAASAVAKGRAGGSGIDTTCTRNDYCQDLKIPCLLEGFVPTIVQEGGNDKLRVRQIITCDDRQATLAINTSRLERWTCIWYPTGQTWICNSRTLINEPHSFWCGQPAQPDHASCTGGYFSIDSDWKYDVKEWQNKTECHAYAQWVDGWFKRPNGDRYDFSLIKTRARLYGAPDGAIPCAGVIGGTGI